MEVIQTERRLAKKLLHNGMQSRGIWKFSGRQWGAMEGFLVLEGALRLLRGGCVGERAGSCRRSRLFTDLEVKAEACLGPWGSEGMEGRDLGG